MSKATYKEILIKVLEMQSKSASDLYQRATLLVVVFDDSEFRADAGNADDHKAADMLDRYVGDSAYSFLQLRAMLIAEPKREAWKTKTLREIWDAASRKAEVTGAATATRRAVKLKDFEQVQLERDSLQSQLAHTRKSGEETIEELRSLLRQREQEIAELKREIAVAQGRIEELERMVEREFANN